MRLIFTAIMFASILSFSTVASDSRWPIIPPPTPDPWKYQTMKQLVNAYAEIYSIDIVRWHMLIQLESGWNRFALSTREASGLCQIWPPTARAYGLQGDLDQIIVQLQDPRINILICAELLRDLLERYNGDWFNVAVAFNAGPSVVTYAQKISRGNGLTFNEQTTR